MAGADSRVRIDLPCQVVTLANGLRLIVHEDRNAPLAAVNIWYHVGSRDEQTGRTGFAHLFEHLMFEGSANVPTGQFDRLLEAAGGSNNGSTTADRTNYWETVPASAVELALFLEADRMGGLLAALTQDRFDTQRDVVMNERRESYENRPYGLAHERILSALYPLDHPYHWPVIGFMDDLTAATLDDAAAFCRQHYTPANASLVVAGAVDTAEVRALVDQHFGPIPGGARPGRRMLTDALAPPRARLVLEDVVQLPRLFIAWHSPAAFAPGDAAMDALAHVLAGSKASRLYRSLVSAELAVEVSAEQESAQLGSSFVITVTAHGGDTLAPLEALVRREIGRLAEDGPDEGEVARARHAFTTGFIDDLQTVGGFGGRADRLNLYEHHLHDPHYTQHDLDRYQTVSAADVRDAARRFLAGVHGVTLSVVPEGHAELAAAREVGL